MTNTLIEQAKAAAAKLKDQTEEKAEITYEPPKAGPAIGRLVSYVEIGVHDQRPYKGETKPPAAEAIIEFELLGKKHAKEIEFEDEHGKKQKKTIHPIIRVRQTLKGGSKSGSYKLTKALDYGRGNTNIAFMLGEAFMLKIIHNKVKQQDGTEKVYANIKDENGVWQISAPVIQKFDDETGEPIGDPKPINAPAPTVELKMLLWDAPTIEQWNSIHIPGTFTTKEDGKEVEKSKNWMQQLVKDANNYEGSGIQQIVSAHEGDLPDMSEGPGDDEDDDTGAQGGSGDDEWDTVDDGSETSENAASGPENGATDDEDDDDDPLSGLDL